MSRDPDTAVEEGGSEEGGSEERVAKAQSVSAVIQHYRKNRDRAIAAPAPGGSEGVYQGIWTSSPEDESDRTPRTYLDISDHYSDPGTAGHAAIANKQKGFYAADPNKTISVWNEDKTKWSAAGINEEVRRVIRDS